ncbi:unnamed protein product, partial [Strongylus vulgaris]
MVGYEDYTEVIVNETLKRKAILLELSGFRSADANRRKIRAWKEVQDVVLLKCRKMMTLDQIKRVWRNKKAHVRDTLLKEKRYRSATGGGLELPLERAISSCAKSFTEAEIALANALGREAVMSGLGKMETFVDKAGTSDGSPSSRGGRDREEEEKRGGGGACLEREEKRGGGGACLEREEKRGGG